MDEVWKQFMNSLISKEAVELLTKNLQPVVEKLGQGGEFILMAYRKQVLVSATMEAIGAFFCFIFCVLIWRNIIKDKDCSHEGTNETLLLVSLFIFGTGIGLFFTFVPKFINPDYYFIQNLLEIVKK
jgi:hypothetical protein